MFSKVATALWLGMAVMTLPMVAFSQPVSEYELKAALIFSVARFIEWPDDVWNEDIAEVTLCIVGEDPFGQSIDGLEGRKLGNATLRLLRTDVHRVRPERCRIAFLVGDESNAIDAQLELFSGHAVLTIGESPGFAAQGGIVGLVKEGARLRFEINPEVATKHRIRVSSQLLQLARLVRTQEADT